MAGHNKWSKIKNKKGKEDARRAKEFTKLGRALMVAAKQGGDNPDYNATLKSAIEKAKSINMPNDNIMRAIKKGVSSSEGDNFEQVTYEGYGPGGIAVIVETLTDNRNRTAPDVRHAFDKFGGNLGTSGSVSFMFDHVGVIVLDQSKYDYDEFMLDALEADVKDIKTEDGMIIVYTEIEDFSSVKSYLTEKTYEFVDSDIMYVAQNYQTLQGQDNLDMEKLIDMLEENDDVQNVYHNWIEDEE
ncbi:MAG: YebC/PmpR family DNA-binding transcriptional regulator [Tissierellia bacterium]|nr:YebC/PmpR family DNA-binding transcriptional regulator [Tissierellia bacterium]